MVYKLYAFAKTPFTPQKAGLRCIPTQILPPSRRRDLREGGGQGVGVRNDYGKERVSVFWTKCFLLETRV
jgi:hypothetical protein